VPPPWRSSGGIEPRASVIAGVPAGRAPAQFRQGRDAVGAEKLVSDQLATFGYKVIRYKNFLVTNLFVSKRGKLV
jgi:hypothetical protein